MARSEKVSKGPTCEQCGKGADKGMLVQIYHTYEPETNEQKLHYAHTETCRAAWRESQQAIIDNG